MAAWFALLALAGCATPPVADLHRAAGALYEARSLTTARSTGDRGAPQSLLAQMLARPIDADAAVQIALLQSPRVAAIYARLGVARADLYDAARLSNPVLGYANLSNGSGGRKIDWSLSQNFTELLFLRFRKAGAESRVSLAEQQVARELMDLEAEVRGAHIRSVASGTAAAMREQIAQTTQVAVAYAQQLLDAGNISRLQFARLQEAADLARVEALRARAAALADRNALLTLLGLDSDSPAKFDGELKTPGTALLAATDITAWALDNRLDLLSAREALRFASIADVHARRWRWLGETTVGIGTEKDVSSGSASAETLTGPTASLALPLFNSGAGSVARTSATVDSLAAGVRALEISIRNDVATRVAALDAAREAVKLYRDQLMPAQQVIVDESQKQHNYMLIGTFELLAAKQHQYDGYDAYIAALRDYWMAYVDLMRAAGGRFPGAQLPADARETALPPAAGTQPLERP